MNGPYQVGKGDLDKFQNTGLKAKIPAGKKVSQTEDTLERLRKLSFQTLMTQMKFENSRVMLAQVMRVSM